MVKTMFFDLGNVLVFFSHERMCKQLASCTGITQEKIRHFLFQENLQKNYETGVIDSASIYQFFQKNGSKPFTFQEFVEAASDIFIPNTQLFRVVEDLKRLGIRLVLLSNTSECHFHKVYEQYALLRLFDDRILFFEVGYMKPDPRIFLKALEVAQCLSKECFYTDDMPEFVDSAKKVGLDGEIFLGVDPLKKALALRGVIV